MQFEGELYILATDQGYLNQPDLVWEKLNEVSTLPIFFFDKIYKIPYRLSVHIDVDS